MEVSGELGIGDMVPRPWSPLLEGRGSWYQRRENNGWRPVSVRVRVQLMFGYDVISLCLAV